MRTTPALSLIALAAAALPAHADPLGTGTMQAGFASPYQNAQTPVNLRLVETDFLVVNGWLIEIPVENPAVYLDWTFSSQDVGAVHTLDAGSPGWAGLIAALTNDAEDAFSEQHSVSWDDPDAPSSGFGLHLARAEADLFGLTGDLSSLRIDRIELHLTRFDTTPDPETGLSISYAIDVRVHGVVPAPATIGAVAPLLLIGRRRRR